MEKPIQPVILPVELTLFPESIYPLQEQFRIPVDILYERSTTEILRERVKETGSFDIMPVFIP